MNTFAFDYMKVATLADTRVDEERRAQYFRELRREAERQEQSRQVWKARWNGVRSLFVSTAGRTTHANDDTRAAAAS